jgi:phosphocarrier protein HPr
MIERQTEIVNRLGLHARAAAKLVHTAGGFQSRVTVVKDGEEVDAKSILGILLLAAGQGSQITIRCDGQDEEEALQAVTTLIANRFDEES